MDFRTWQAEGQRISAISKGSSWWIGDWLLYCASAWGERYTEARRITGMDSKTLRNIRWVAASFEPSRRREGLSFSHHELLAGLDADEQEAWLVRAERERMTVEDLRIELRTAERGGYARAHKTESKDPARPIVACPKCGEAIPIPDDVIQTVRSGPGR